MKNLRLTLDTLDLLGSPREVRVVVLNRSDAKVGLRPRTSSLPSSRTSLSMVPNSQSVPASVNRGVPIVLDEPRHPVSVAMRQLADEYVRPLAQGVMRGRQKNVAERMTPRVVGS